MLKYRILGLFIFVGMGYVPCFSGQTYKGYPSTDNDTNLKENFVSPPKGYGTVPFYWWDGDSLKKERLADQLKILKEAPVDGFSVSYMHSHPQIDRELNASGYGGFGKPDPGKPEVFSDDWWQVWNWFAGECADNGIGLGLDDYVLGWEKNGYYVDELLADKKFKNYQGRLVMNKYVVGSDSVTDIVVPGTMISVTAYPEGADLSGFVADGKLSYRPKSEQTVYVVASEPSHELHPEYGSRLLDVYFKRFEDRLDARGRKSLNYFFQDELHYNLTIRSWAEDMPEEFIKRKGYDVVPYLAALFDDIGDITPKIRLDYADVLTQLSEERYFKPIYDWHSGRGLIYGCDNNGRGLEPLQYLDYFRMTSWFTAPGNDAPARGSSFRQTKVSSSISHLYERPRTWLEAFHSMGWDSNGEWLTSQLDHHIIAGGNLLCLHGLYYSTHGGWWEWAPPCFYFRMPYWPHMKKWMEYGERLCYLLSQGHHVCDIAILYPTESMQAYSDANTDKMWEVGDKLSKRGLDYDYIDFHSLDRAMVENGELSVAGERYKVLVLPDVKAMHFSTLQKILEFSRGGGIVISTGDTLRATTRNGENDAVTEAMWRGIFADGSGHIIEASRIPDAVSGMITPDFSTTSGEGTVLHRRIGKYDVYMVMNVEKGAEMFFRAKGKAERWNAKDGSVVSQPVERQDEKGTWIKFDGEPNMSYLYVFTPGEPVYDTGKHDSYSLTSVVDIDGEWDIEIIPTMNNKWGDFRLPASDEMIGPEVREFKYRYVGYDEDALSTGVFDSTLYGFGPKMELAVIDRSNNLDECLSSLDKVVNWETYSYSWQYGVKDSPGSQGYHGLKGKVDNRFMILDRGGHQIFRTYTYIAEPGKYVIEKEGVEPYRIMVDGNNVDAASIDLAEGWHDVVVAYADTPKSEYRLEDKKSYCWDDRERSAVVLYPEGHPCLKDNDPYGRMIATKWYGSGHAPYSTVKGGGVWEYVFRTAPATKLLNMHVNGEILTVYIDGIQVDAVMLKRLGSSVYELACDDTDGHIHEVRMLAKPEIGYDGPAFFDEPVRLTCGAGKLPAGNWSDFGALKYFSGGIKYKKSVKVNDTEDWRFEVDLGLVDATCEVSVNGKPVDVMMNTPYRLDITDYLRRGDNILEVLVYSTLSNHYQSVPSAYRGEPRAGLIGPVKLEVSERGK